MFKFISIYILTLRLFWTKLICKTQYLSFLLSPIMVRWMDGSFLDLNGESMEVEVDEFLREIYKCQKMFQQKWKKAEQESENVAAVKRQPGEEDRDKQESPTAAVCCRVIEQIKEFKVHQNN